MPRPTLPVDTSSFTGQVSAEIRRRRLAKFPIAEDAAQRAGVPIGTWYRWETGHVTLEALPRIAKALRCSPRLLLPAT